MRFTKPILTLGSLVIFAGCGITEAPLRNNDGLVSKSTYKQAIATSSKVADVPMRGQILEVSRANLGDSSFAVIQFVQGDGWRKDQPDMRNEVIPVVERRTGCAVTDKRKFGPSVFLPREKQVVLPIECVPDLPA